MVLLRQSFAYPFRETKAHLLVECAKDEGFLRMQSRELNIINPEELASAEMNLRVYVKDLPLGPLPSEVEIAQMMRKPIHEPVA